ncbi:MAG: NTP transferase domain-containing protein [Patescibacteria group bacterium]
MLRQAVVAAGGKGTRLGTFAQRYGNKSLVPIERLPVLGYTLEWLKEVGVEEIIVTVNYMTEYRRIEELFGKDSRITMAYNRYRKNSAQCISPLRGKLDSRFIFIYGHAPVPPSHLRNLVEIAKEGVAVSLYPNTTQGATRKPARLLGHLVTLEASGSLFVETPHVLNHEFVELLAKTSSWGVSFQRYQGQLVGVRAHHPSEFHYQHNFVAFRKYMIEFLKSGK